MDYSEVSKIKIYPLWFIITKISAFKKYRNTSSERETDIKYLKHHQENGLNTNFLVFKT